MMQWLFLTVLSLYFITEAEAFHFSLRPVIVKAPTIPSVTMPTTTDFTSVFVDMILLIRNYYGQDFYFICYRLVRSFEMKLYDKGNRIKLYQNFILT